MRKSNYKPAKVGSKFLGECMEVKALRILSKRDKKELSIERISDAFTKTRAWGLVKKEAIDMPKEEDLK